MRIPFQVRASAVFALGTLLDVGFDSSRNGGDEECDDDEKIRAETNILKSLLNAVSDGSPLVRAEVAVGMYTLCMFHEVELFISSMKHGFLLSFRVLNILNQVWFDWKHGRNGMVAL